MGLETPGGSDKQAKEKIEMERRQAQKKVAEILGYKSVQELLRTSKKVLELKILSMLEAMTSDANELDELADDVWEEEYDDENIFTVFRELYYNAITAGLIKEEVLNKFYPRIGKKKED